MFKKVIISAIALTISTSAFAADAPVSTPKPECCCCKKDKDGKMTCGDKHGPVGQSATGHEGH